MTSTLPAPKWLVSLLKARSVPGACVGVVSRSGQSQIWTYGQAHIIEPTPVRAETCFHLFSGTKLYTATALMLLAERGQLALDDSLESVLPGLGLRHAVTLRQLASHSSGLPETLRALLACHFPPSRGPPAAEARSRFSLSGGGVPGRKASYRNVNYAVLGEVIARRAGSSYESFLEAEVLRPLGSAAHFHHEVAGALRQASGHMKRWSAMRLVLRLLAPATADSLYAQAQGSLIALRSFEIDTAAIGGLLGAVGDFLPLLAEMLNPGHGLLRAETKAAMLSLQTHGAAGIMSREGVGIGWKAGRVEDTRFWNHEGGGPGFCSETRLYPSMGVGIVVLMNLSQSLGLSRAAHRICEVIRGAGVL